MQAVVVRNLFVAALVLLLTPAVVAFSIATALTGLPNAPGAAVGQMLFTVLESNHVCLPFMVIGAICLIVAIRMNRSKQARLL